jgi:hypothetical protein
MHRERQCKCLDAHCAPVKSLENKGLPADSIRE